MNVVAPLWAAMDINDLVKVGLILLFIVIPAIGQILAKMKQAQRPGGGLRTPKPPMPAPAGNVGDEIEEFMRRTAKGVRPNAKRQPAAGEPVRAEVVAERPVGGQVTEHIKKYLDQSEFSRRTSQLGGEVAQADRQIDQRLHKKFDHAVSRLAGVPGEAAVAPVAIATPDLAASISDLPVTSPAGLALLLTNPDSLRQAIVLNEILHRPEERWG
ncbi:MAG: hypothetical protein NT090_19120 [Acidobacteria bacterium]|nr:hypothetical protein [Acidobacteriota bacterium]